jgi:hypothetical protein
MDLARPDAWVNAAGYQGVAERVDDEERLETIRRYAADYWAEMHGIDAAVSAPVAEAPVTSSEPATVVPPVPLLAIITEPDGAPKLARLPVSYAPAPPMAAEPVTDVLTVVKPADDQAPSDWNNEPTAALPVLAEAEKPLGNAKAFRLSLNELRRQLGWYKLLRSFPTNWDTALVAGRILTGTGRTGSDQEPETRTAAEQTRAARVARTVMEGIRRNKAAVLLGVAVVGSVVSAFLLGPSEAGQYIPAKFDLGGISRP